MLLLSPAETLKTAAALVAPPETAVTPPVVVPIWFIVPEDAEEENDPKFKAVVCETVKVLTTTALTVAVMAKA